MKRNYPACGAAITEGRTPKERPEGSGLGLAIAKQIVMLHGGDIFVKSSPGDGTEFIILLPFETDAN